MVVRYTRHARYKFEVLKQYGFPVTPERVLDVLLKPDVVIPQSGDRFIAQKRISRSIYEGDLLFRLAT